MTTTTQTPVVTPFNNHFGTSSSAGVVYSYVNNTPQSTTPPQSSSVSASSSQHQSPIQQDSSDCGSSSGVGGSGMTNKHESDASSLDSDSRDSGAAPGLPLQVQQQLQQQQHNGIVPAVLAAAQTNGILAHHHGYPSHIIPSHPHPLQPQPQQQRYPPQHQHQQHPRHWAPTTTIPPPPPLPPPGVPPPPVSIRPLYTMTVSPGNNGYDTRQPPPPQSSSIITAGPTMTQSNSMGTIPGGISSPSINGSSNSGTTTNNPATSGIPTQSQIPPSNGTHEVYIHIQAGEIITILAGTEMQHIQGPATIRMIGQSNISPNALPLRVPQGHLVQQILDEHGRLKHVILSPQATATSSTTANAASATGAAATTRSNNIGGGVVPTVLPIPRGSGATTPLKGIIPNAIPSTSNGTSPKSISPPVPVQFSQGPLINPEMIADPNYLAIRNLQQQQQSNQWNGSKRSSSGGYSTGPIPLPSDALHPYAVAAAAAAAMTGYNILPHSLPPNSNVIHTGNPYGNGLIPGSGPSDETDYEFEEDERERERLREALASIAAPQIQRVYPKEVEVSWQEIDTSEAAASGGPFPQIDASEFIYEVFVFEGKPQGSPTSCHRCEPQSGNVLKIEKLKPNTQYCVNIRASLPERDVIGAFSQATFFRTLSILHEIPPPPKIGNRGPTWLHVSWKNALNMSLLIKTIIVQYAKATGKFMTFYEGSSDSIRITNLEPLTSYRVRIILRTDMGDTEPSQPSYAQTAASSFSQQSQQAQAQQQQPLVQQQQPLQQQQSSSSAHQNGPSSSNQEIKIPPPQINGCFNRSIRLIWQPVYGYHNYTLEYCEARTNDFHPIDERDYNNNGANVGHLQSNREYYFRLCVVTETGQTLRSEVISARTRKDQYENSSYQNNNVSSSTISSGGGGPNTSSSYYDNNRDRLQVPTHLQKTYMDEKTLELTWRYSGREFDTLIFILEGSVASAENNNQPESSWRICYKGPNTSAIINDITFNLFRVQATNSRKHTSSAWSESLFVKRVIQQRPKRSIPDGNSNSIPSTPASTTTTPATAAAITPSTCTAPKFSEITWCSMQVQWKLSEDLSFNNKTSLIYELQRVDTEPIIIYSGDQTSYKLENLKAIEHVQVRVRAVIVDYSGKRMEGDWSPIGSACTTCTTPSPPVNLRLAVEGPIPTLAWDPPTQLNGADIKSYVLTGTKTPLTGDEKKPVLKRFGETSKTEFSLGKVEPATHFAIKIVANSKGGESDPSEIFEFDSPPSEPEAPQDLHIEAISSTELSLTWTPGTENGSPITEYRLFVHELSSESRSASKHLIAQHQISEDITSFIASKLKPATLYELEILAKNSVGISDTVSMRCETFASPPDPPELSLVQAQSNVLKLKWQSSIASSSSSTYVEPCYFYLEKENDFGTFSPVFEGESKMAKIKNLHEDTVHRFRIRSAHAKGIPSLMGPWSETYEFSTTRPPPPAVKGSLMVSEVSQSVFQIEWLPVKLVTNDGSDKFVYRLQVVPKPERRTVVEPWKTVYEGTCPSYTLSLSPTSSSARMARVFVVQKLENNEELCSAPSAIAQFSTCRTPNESPRKRINKQSASSGNSTSSQPSEEDDQPTRSPSSVHRANRMNWQRRTKRWINFVRKAFADRNSSAVVLLLFFVLAMFIALCLNNYYQL